jgi:hypothetical protein
MVFYSLTRFLGALALGIVSTPAFAEDPATGSTPTTSAPAASAESSTPPNSVPSRAGPPSSFSLPPATTRTLLPAAEAPGPADPGSTIAPKMSEAAGQKIAHWTVGIGFSTPTITVLSSSSSSESIVQTSPPTISVLVERRLTGQLWLMFIPSLSYDEIQNPSEATTPATTLNDYGAEGAIGARFVLNPGAVVEVSPFVTVNAGYFISTTTSPPQPLGVTAASQTISQIVGGAGAGLVFECPLTQGLAVRIALTLLDFDYASFTETIGAGAPTTSTSISVGLEVQPRLEVRLAF